MKTSIITLLIILSMILIAGCTTSTQQQTTTTIGVQQMTPELCKQAGGNWNECGSPCAGTGSEFCIQVCQAQCECGGIAGFNCPVGYTCRLSGKIADEIGVCISESNI